MHDVIVVGGGPSGAMAAGRAAERGKKVLLLEKRPNLGSKLLISGKGRCNLTNTVDIDGFIQEFGANGRFLRNACARYFSDDLVTFFEGQGVRCKVERGGRVFPVSDRASEIAEALERYLKKSGVEIEYGREVVGITAGNGAVTGVEIAGHPCADAEKVVLATGGYSYPATGSTGFGFEAARRLGHTVVAPRPALVGVETEGPFAKRLMGLSLKNVTCALYADGKVVEKRFGEMLFTHHGISGPIILEMSKRVGEIIGKGSRATVAINLKPALEPHVLDDRLVREFQSTPNADVGNILKRLMPQRLIDVILDLWKVGRTRKGRQITKEERAALAGLIAGLPLTVTRTRPIEEAIVTAGGVSLKEIDPKTMGSKVVKGLYIVGELLDIDAGTGGFNLQAAFSTGYVCGEDL